LKYGRRSRVQCVCPSKGYQLIKRSSQAFHQAKNKLVEREKRGTSDNGRSHDFCNTLLNGVNPREAIAVPEYKIMKRPGFKEKS